jgi:hypothetical protein
VCLLYQASHSVTCCQDAKRAAAAWPILQRVSLPSRWRPYMLPLRGPLLAQPGPPAMSAVAPLFSEKPTQQRAEWLAGWETYSAGDLSVRTAGTWRPAPPKR